MSVCLEQGPRVSVVIPTLGREDVLVRTLERVMALGPAHETIVVDQTERHEADTTEFLSRHHERGRLRWLRRSPPSIPGAMNAGLLEAGGTVVLFLDDDVEPSTELLVRHMAAHDEFSEAWAVAGQVLQPGVQPTPGKGSSGRGFWRDLEFPFASTDRAWVLSVMAGNLSVKRARALQVGGFDENFEGVAYRFETEFCRRLADAGGRTLFEPGATLRHLRAPTGGTRTAGSHLTSVDPIHSMGDYYFAMKAGLSFETVTYMLRRPLREVATRFHLRHPWFIPVKWIAEVRAFLWALEAIRRGPRYASAHKVG